MVLLKPYYKANYEKIVKYTKCLVSDLKMDENADPVFFIEDNKSKL
jgi:hypothetical protein